MVWWYIFTRSYEGQFAKKNNLTSLQYVTVFNNRKYLIFLTFSQLPAYEYIDTYVIIGNRHNGWGYFECYWIHINQNKWHIIELWPLKWNYSWRHPCHVSREASQIGIFIISADGLDLNTCLVYRSLKIVPLENITV